MYTLYCRCYQAAFRKAAAFLPWREPLLLEGQHAVLKLADAIKKEKIERILIITDKGISRLGLMDEMLSTLEQAQIHYRIYDGTEANPTIENIENALKLYHDDKCQGMIAFGGGSPIDCAKGVGARVARPNKTIPQMRGTLKVRKDLPMLFAVPTTAGTGSEATVAAVVTNSETHEKYALIDTSLIPHYAVLDPFLTVSLPPAITAATGIDALTHAVEAYIGKSNTAETRKLSLDAVKLIFENLETAFADGGNITARLHMQKAAYYAGLAFTRAFVGNVHAIAHTLGGFYGVPHGLANAVILPYVLDYYGDTISKPLSQLAAAAGIGNEQDSSEERAKLFIAAIQTMNKNMQIPEGFDCIAEKDIPLLAKRALAEANPLYPVPKIMDNNTMVTLYHQIKK